MSSKDKKLNVIITNSFQNDFIEPLDDLLSKPTEDDLRLDYGICREKWIEYFTTLGRSVSELTIKEFLSWLKYNSQNTLYHTQLSYHRILEKFKHRVHLDYDETQRIWKESKLKQFLYDLMDKAKIANNEETNGIEYQFIHLRDWHDQLDPDERSELEHFGFHCLKGTHGSKFASPLDELIKKNIEFNIVLNSNSISSFDETNLESILATLVKNSGGSKRETNIGIFGVVTNVKVQLLAYELMVIHKFNNVYICEDFCGGFNNEGHKAGLDIMRNVFAAKIVDHNEFRRIFQI